VLTSVDVLAERRERRQGLKQNQTKKDEQDYELSRMDTGTRTRTADCIKRANGVVHAHTNAQKFKRENPTEAYKDVKSKVAGNMKSINKQKRREVAKDQSPEPYFDQTDDVRPKAKGKKTTAGKKATLPKNSRESKQMQSIRD
jgi:hypothetical protein